MERCILESFAYQVRSIHRKQHVRKHVSTVAFVTLWTGSKFVGVNRVLAVNIVKFKVDKICWFSLLLVNWDYLRHTHTLLCRFMSNWNMFRANNRSHYLCLLQLCTGISRSELQSMFVYTFRLSKFVYKFHK